MTGEMIIGGRAVKARPGDSEEHIARIEAEAARILDETRLRLVSEGEERGAGGDEAAICALAEAIDRLILSQDENTRLRRELSELRARHYAAEGRIDELSRENSVLRLRLSALQMERAGGAIDGVQ